MPKLTDLASIAQCVQAIATLILLFIANNIRESIKSRHLDGMKYVRDLIVTQDAADKRKWVYQELDRVAKPLSSENADKVRAICRDFDHIGLLCRKGLLPTKIIIETYNKNIIDMWSRLKPSIDEFRRATNDEDYFLEFEWLAHQTTKTVGPLARILRRK